MSKDRIPVMLVPVEVFGTDHCCRHHPDGLGIDEPVHPDCQGVGYGLSDAVSSWSDCNRAVGHIFRFDDIEARSCEYGERLTVWVDPDEYEKFAATRWGDPNS